MKKLIFVLLIFLLFVCYTYSDFAEKNWLYLKRVIAPTTDFSTEQLVQVYLDAEVYEHSNKDLSDLRIIGEGEKEIPCKIITEKEIVETVSYSPKLLNNSFIPRSHSLFVLDLGDKPTEHNSLIINTPSKTFARWVEVWGSKDNDRWYQLQMKGLIYDHHVPEANVKSRNTRVDYPLSDYRYVKVVVWNEKEEPLKITGATLQKVIKIPAKEIEWSTKILSRELDSKEKAIVTIMDLEKDQLPHNKIKILSPEVNFHRYLKIWESKDKENWSYLSGGEIYSYTTPKYKAKKDELIFQESRLRYLKVALYHYDDPPLKINEMKILGTQRKVSFIYQPKEEHFLYYGNQNATSPRYDFGKIYSYLEKKEISTLDLDKEVKNPNFSPSKIYLWQKYQKYFLGIIMLIIVVILGFFILRIMRELKTT